MPTRQMYDCDTSPYWCSEEDYNNKDKKFGAFVEDGRAYRIDDPETPRPWLNYLSNKKFGSVISNKGLGFPIALTFFIIISLKKKQPRPRFRVNEANIKK